MHQPFRLLHAAVLSALLPWAAAAGQATRPQPSDAGPSDVTAAQQVLAADDARRLAMLHGDARALDTLLAADATIFWGDGTADDKTSALELFRSGQLRYARLDYDSSRVRVYGQTAVVTGRGHVEAQSDQHALQYVVRLTRVYVRQQSRWRLVASQTTRIAPPP